MRDPILDAHIRSARYWNIDGLTEIAIGLQVLLVPVFLYGVTQTSRGSVERVAVVLALAAGLPAAALLSRRLIVAIRRRFTYPRTGFVAYRRQRAEPWAYGAALVTTLVLLFLILKGATTNWVTWLFVLQGLVPGGLTIYFGRVVGLLRFQAVGLFYAVFGIAVALAEPGLIRGMMIFWAASGTVSLLSGAWTCWRYFRMHPDRAETQ